MNNIVIITGHGNFATGLKNSIELIAGFIDGVYAVDFNEDDSDKTLKNKIKEILDKHSSSPTLIVCDIVGGTPFKVAAEFITAGYRSIELVAGCNLSGLLEVILQKDKVSINELAESAVNTTKNTVLLFDRNMIQKSTNENGEETAEGI